jgi:hypothetical protein
VGHVSNELTRKFNFSEEVTRSIQKFELNTISALDLGEEEIKKREYGM